MSYLATRNQRSSGSDLIAQTTSSLIELINRDRTTAKKVAEELSAGKYAEATIRFSHYCAHNNKSFSLTKAGFDPSQPRNNFGEWTKIGVDDSRKKPDRQISEDDPFCKIVKELCIVEATDTLPTKDFGASFFKALNACMDRHGCLGRA